MDGDRGKDCACPAKASVPMPLTSEFSYDLPGELIAQKPARERTRSRMMVLERCGETIRHSVFADLPRYLREGDLLVVNDTRVTPARVYGTRTDTGGRVELLLLDKLGAGNWRAMYRASRPAREGIPLSLADGQINGTVRGKSGRGVIEVELEAEREIDSVLEQKGFAPLPPYIKRKRGKHGDSRADRERYQTVYARNPGAVAAPTAGLHFDEELLKTIEEGGTDIAAVTLHVGAGTFRPVKTERIEEHPMHEERYRVDERAAEAVERTKKAGGRVIAVGTTTARTLEAVFAEMGRVAASEGRTDLFIYPPYEFRVVDAMLTNFHLPRSTLLMMICAFAGKDFVFSAYGEAIRRKYRFYSFGDCMLIM
ncbi:MAG: tRNA preQ1(34) S-adenosylmethionine ribosyltransferase-isomerase QueA [Kiritimatiellia bacterium]